MIAVKRVEIVVEAPHSGRVTALLERRGLTGWSLLRSVMGAGDRGRQHNDEMTGVNSNHLIVTTCPPDELDGLIEDLRPILAHFGGMCLVSDASWLKH